MAPGAPVPGGTPTVAIEAAPAAPEAEVNRLVDELKLPARRKEARAAIVALGQAATPTLLTRMKDPDFTVRWEMANVQGDILDPRAIDPLIENVLGDVDPHIRWRSLWALTLYPDTSRAVAGLVAALDGQDEARRWNAAVGLSLFRRADGLALLHQGAVGSDDWRSWEAVNALGRIHDASSAGVLARVLAGGNERNRGEAAMSLGSIGGGEAERVLVAALADPAAGVRWRACQSLATLATAESLPALERLDRDERDPTVREHLARALARARLAAASASPATP